MPESDPAEWVTCRMCGGAVPPNATSCPSCLEAQPAVRPADVAKLPGRQRRRIRFLQGLRIAIVLAVVVGLTFDIASAVWTGSPTFPDPLTTRGTLSVPAGNFSYLAGWITGEDYIDGNFTVVYPVGVPINFVVYNGTEFTKFLEHQPTDAIWSTSNQSSSRIIFAAPYTDQFFLTFQNPYPPSSGIDVQIYEVTNYQTNVVIG